MKEIKAEIVRDTNNIRCLVNIEELTIGECAVLARDHLTTAMSLLNREDFHSAVRAIEAAWSLADLCLRARNQEEQWIESLPTEEEAA
ncbi:hypothetical protein MYX64_06480 [Nitrospinae bacterium AH_259_B05_G02_I21]|nr:hypothetical protein [Nitrospinae bacterium AH_259_B05_G02_I21]